MMRLVHIILIACLVSGALQSVAQSEIKKDTEQPYSVVSFHLSHLIANMYVASFERFYRKNKSIELSVGIGYAPTIFQQVILFSDEVTSHRHEELYLVRLGHKFWFKNVFVKPAIAYVNTKYDKEIITVFLEGTEIRMSIQSQYARKAILTSVFGYQKSIGNFRMEVYIGCGIKYQDADISVYPDNAYRNNDLPYTYTRTGFHFSPQLGLKAGYRL